MFVLVYCINAVFLRVIWTQCCIALLLSTDNFSQSDDKYFIVWLYTYLQIIALNAVFF